MEGSAQDKNQHSSKTISERENQASNQGGHSLKFVERGGRRCSLLEYTTQSALTTRTTMNDNGKDVNKLSQGERSNGMYGPGVFLVFFADGAFTLSPCLYRG